MRRAAPIEDYTTGRTGTGCRITAAGTGTQFDHVGVPFDAAATALQAHGWTEDVMHAGGGPGGVLAGYRQEAGLCLLGGQQRALRGRPLRRRRAVHCLLG